MATAAVARTVGSAGGVSCRAKASVCSSSRPFLAFSGLKSNTLLLKQQRDAFQLARCNKRTAGVVMAATLDLLDFSGKPLGTETLDLNAARPETARAVVHRGLITELQNKRQGNAHTKTRSEVRGGGRKPYKQKGTGNARRGSTRSPLIVGGGVAFGPRSKSWRIKMNKKEKRLSISTALQSAATSTVVVEDFDDKFEEPSTKKMISALQSWGVAAEEEHVLLLLHAPIPRAVAKSISNINNAKVMTPGAVNLYDILRADKLVITKSMLQHLNERYPPKGALAEEDESEEEPAAEAAEEAA
ncbi:chloroplast ribosomal protein L4 precursor [Klebsormidium nitens]|uniref:Large ribosomal subunit protein uL4c n=1 Tax=Klebsormidium nitens TaxID=105231 RepID=A0A1Y1I2W1_KLENI|nr:chloroplast ribosomal protein L4 precursor [Klebsormidium nitens]|eukprot:GAQ83749.1 chloroplast ribosomal protein L4 precursor [Klebsormidium nitens]